MSALEVDIEVEVEVEVEVDEPASEEVPLDLSVKETPLDLTMKKEDNSMSEVEVEREDQEEFFENAQLIPLDLSVVRAIPFQSPPPLQSPPSPTSKSQTQCKIDSSSPTMAVENLAPLHGMYGEAMTYQRMISSSAVLEYNPFLPIFPTSVDTQFYQQNHIQNQLHYMHMQQQHQLQLQLHQLYQQKFQLQATYGDIPLEPALMLSGNPTYVATSSPTSFDSNHFPSPTTNDHQHQHQQQQEWELDLEHRPHIETCTTDNAQSVVDPEEVAAIYRQSEFLWFRHRYMENLRPQRNFQKTRWSRNNNYNGDNDDHRLMPGQQQYNQTDAIKQQKKNEATKRLRDAKRQKHIDNQISVMYLAKKVSEMKDIKKRLLNTNSDMLAE